MNKSTRLVELDFFRGAALLVIFWDHLHWFVQTGFPLHYGFSDAAAVFVFISGYVSGLVYWKIYNIKGLRGVFVKALKRSAQIYAVHIFAVIALLGIAFVTPSITRQDPVHAFLNTFTENPFGIIIQIVSLQYFPDLFDILPLYIILMLTIPGIIFFIKRDWRIIFWLSFAIYCATQFIPALNIQLYFPSWSFNPLSWFFLFATAVIIGIKNYEGALPVLKKPIYTIAAISMLVYSFLDLKTINQLLNNAGIIPDGLMFMFPSPFPLIAKINLQPVSLIHFFCLAYVVSSMVPSLRSFLKNKFAYLVVYCGQHSLSLFSCGIVITYLFAYLIFLLGETGVYFYAFELIGWAVTLSLGFFLSKRKYRIKAANHKPQIKSVSVQSKVKIKKTGSEFSKT